MKVGDYCRTKEGFIARLIGKDTWYRFDSTIAENEYTYNYLSQKFVKELIIKSSPNIIDLIEVGDYVNEERIQFITNKKELLTDGGYDLLKKYEDIKSIVTHEQFSQMEYKVGD